MGRLGEHSRLVLSVPPVLPGEAAEGLPRPVDGPDRRIEDDATTVVSQALVELEVLVPVQVASPAAEAAQRLRPEAAEVHRVDVSPRFAG
jgi:hypothetical protein